MWNKRFPRLFWNLQSLDLDEHFSDEQFCIRTTGTGFECLCWKTFLKVICTLSVFTTSLSFTTLNTLLLLSIPFCAFLLAPSCFWVVAEEAQEEILASSVLATAAFSHASSVCPLVLLTISACKASPSCVVLSSTWSYFFLVPLSLQTFPSH